jgi:acetyl-CoA carboxylase biotin carboxyl carrier protein
VQEAAQAATGRAVDERQRVLAHAQPGARDVDRHPDLHPEPRRERQRRPQRGRRQRTLAGDRSVQREPAAAPHRPAGEPQREPEAAARAPLERTDGEVGLPAAHGVREPHEVRRGVREIPVAEHDHLAGPHPTRRQRRRPALPQPPRRAHDLRARRPRNRGRPVARRIVRHQHARGSERRGQRGERRRQPFGFVARAHDDGDVGAHCGLLSRPQTRGRSAVAGIEAHITGTVWKIEVAIGDAVEEGDTVLILESMKMEMPVEAEDEGTVSEILVTEGQSVSEGDTLVVLE